MVWLILNDRWKSLAFLNNIYALTIQGVNHGLGNDLFQMPFAIAGSLSEPKDDKDTYDDRRDAANCAAHGWCNN
jgi:hypothetical protein